MKDHEFLGEIDLAIGNQDDSCLLLWWLDSSPLMTWF